MGSSVVVVATGTVVGGSTGLARLPRWWNRGLVTVCTVLLFPFGLLLLGLQLVGIRAWRVVFPRNFRSWQR